MQIINPDIYKEKEPIFTKKYIICIFIKKIVSLILKIVILFVVVSKSKI